MNSETDYNTKSRLLGTWHLVAWTIEYSDGRAPTLPFGEDATGLLMYTSDGYMTACIARSGRPGFTTANPSQLPETEKVSAFASYFQYAGTYEVIDDHVMHHVTHSLNPDFPLTTRKRRIELDGNTLVLSAREVLPKEITRRHRLRWQRQ